MSWPQGRNDWMIGLFLTLLTFTLVHPLYLSLFLCETGHEGSVQGARDVAQLIKYLCSTHNALGWIPGTE